MHEVLAECGVDLRYGRRLPGLMRAAGLVECGAEGRVFIHQPHSPGLRMGSMGRVLAPQLSDQLVQQAIVENRAGVSGNIGAEAVAKAPGDDYTLLLSALTSYSINYTLEHGSIRYDLTKDLARSRSSVPSRVQASDGPGSSRLMSCSQFLRVGRKILSGASASLWLVLRSEQRRPFLRRG